MWNGDPGHDPSEGDTPTDQARLAAATALARYTTVQRVPTSAVVPSAVAPQAVVPTADPTFGFSAATTPASLLTTYQSQAMEALRRQEEIRTLLALQQHPELGYAPRTHIGGLPEVAAAAAALPIYNATGFTRHAGEVEQPHVNEHHVEEMIRTSPLKSSAKSSAVRTQAEPDIAPVEVEMSTPEENVAEQFADATIESHPADPLVEPAPAKAEVEAEIVVEPVEEKEAVEAVPVVEVAKKKKAPKRSKSPGAQKKKPSAVGSPTIDDAVPDITAEEYENAQELMLQFCRVPLLAEFSRPVSLLHPELLTVYGKIVKHPMDLGQVCRRIRRRQYKHARAIQMDMWRIFANCVKYHTHPSNKENAVPAFISIALHLREYFNSLWQEYMMPSDPPAASPSNAKNRGPALLALSVFQKRASDRVKRIASTSTTILSSRCLVKTATALDSFVTNGGIVDRLDSERLFKLDNQETHGDFEVLADNLRQLRKRLLDIAQSEHEYTVEEFERDVKRCYNVDLFDDLPAVKRTVGNRLDRLMGKLLVPIYETSCRGVNQSSIWGCMAAAIWARESSKKPYWPALVLGIMAPDDQKEDWHMALTERNEMRLPEKLRSELQTGKRKSEQALKRQNSGGAEQMSFFLVEFMGTHEFIWVKESDIIETFDPDDDPNVHIAATTASKKKRSSRSVTDSKTFASALEEGRWALEEFELQLRDTCGDLAEEEEDDGQDLNYSYGVLCQSDEEAESTQDDQPREAMTMSDVEEANELLATDGLLDYSTEGRKNARKRALARKKQKADAEKKEKNEQAKKAKIEQSKKKSKAKTESREAKKQEKYKDKDDTKERELEKKRKKRARERDREDSRKKLRRTSTPDLKTLIMASLSEKKGRASAIVKAYITRLLKKEDIKNLCLGGVMNIPASIVDSSGILGMALAFRAAAGEIPMPESAEAYSKFEPWDEIDTESPTSATERIKGLKAQLGLLEDRMKSVKATTQKRIDLRIEALKKVETAEKDTFELETKARQVIMGRASSKKKTAKAEPAKDNNDVVAAEPDRVEGVGVEVAEEAVVVEAQSAAETSNAEVTKAVTEDQQSSNGSDVDQVMVAVVDEAEPGNSVKAVSE